MEYCEGKAIIIFLNESISQYNYFIFIEILNTIVRVLVSETYQTRPCDFYINIICFHV